MSRIALVIALATISLSWTAPAAADVLELKDGSVVEGVVEMRETEALVLSRFGTSSISRDQIVKHVKGPSVDAQIKQHIAALEPDDMDGRVRLGAWLKDIGRDFEGEALARQVLEVEPEHDGAQKLLGNVRFRGRWMTPDAAKRAQGLEKHGDRWYTPAEWKHVDEAGRAAALAQEKAALEAAHQLRVKQLAELLVSPDPSLRKRARTALRSLAKERGVPKQRIDQALKAADAYVKRLDDVMVRAGGAGSSRGSRTHAGRGWMLADVHNDFTRLRRPVQEFMTSLASSGAPVRLLLPELRHVRVRSTVAVPLLGLTPSR